MTRCTEHGCKRARYGRLLLCLPHVNALIRQAFGTPEANEKGRLPDRPGGAAIEAA